MATIETNIKGMAALVAGIKKEHHLSEDTILRIIDMNFALAERNGPAVDEDDEATTDEFDTPDDPEQMLLFPDINGVNEPATEDDILATVEPPKPLEN